MSILLRSLHGTTSGTDYGYSVGHVRSGSSHRTKVRKIVGGVAILLASGGAVSPAFNHNEWFWVEFHINGVTMNARYWQEGDTRPGSALLTVASDTTYTSAMGHPGMSFLGNSTLNMDIAEFHFVPL